MFFFRYQLKPSIKLNIYLSGNSLSMIFPRDGKINSVCMRCPSKGKIKSLKIAGVSNSDLTAPKGVANDLFSL